MTVKEWLEADLDCDLNEDDTFNFRCTAAHEADLPTEVKGGSVAMIDDGTMLLRVKMLRKDAGTANWIVLKEM